MGQNKFQCSIYMVGGDVLRYMEGIKDLPEDEPLSSSDQMKILISNFTFKNKFVKC